MDGSSEGPRARQPRAGSGNTLEELLESEELDVDVVEESRMPQGLWPDELEKQPQVLS